MRFVLVLNRTDNMDSDWTATLLSEFFAVANEPPTAQFIEVARQVSAMGPKDVNLHVESPIAVQIKSSLDEEPAYEHIRGVWNSLMTIKNYYGGYRIPAGFDRQCATDRDETPMLQCEFVVGPMDVYVTNGVLTVEFAALLVEMTTLSDGLPFSYLGFNTGLTDVDGGGVDDRAAVCVPGRLLERVLCGDDNERRARLNDATITIDNYQCEPSEFARLCSAITESRGARLLKLNFEMIDVEEESRRWMWERLAYAAFSKHSCMAIPELALRGICLTIEDAEAIARVLTADDPTSELFRPFGDNNAVDNSLQHRHVGLRRGTPVTPQRMHGNESTFMSIDGWWLQDNVRGVRTLDDDGESSRVCVLIPGYGTCTVARSDLQPEIETECIRPTTLAALTLETDYYAPLEGLPRFLELVSANLECLRIEEPSNRSVSIDAECFKWCPRLRSLALWHVELHVPDFLQVCRGNHLRYLSELECNFSDVVLLAEELSDMSTQLAQSLRSWKYTSDLRAPDFHLHMRAFVNMLQANRRLEYFKIVVPRSMGDIAETYIGDLDRMALPVMCGLFPLQSRIALLSIFAFRPQASVAAESATISGDIRQLVSPDKHVLRIIFSFAAACVERHIFIERRNR